MPFVAPPSACSSPSPLSSPPAAARTTTARGRRRHRPPSDAAAATAYVEKGPYSVGTTTLDLNGRKVEVWYPADDVPAGAQQVIFEIRDLLPENLKTIVPDDLNPKYPTDAYRDIPASAEGPFPLVLFAHGFAALPDRVPVPADAPRQLGHGRGRSRLQRARSARRAHRRHDVDRRDRRDVGDP